MLRTALPLTCAVALATLSVPTEADTYIYLRQTGNSNPNGNGVYQNGGGATGGGSYLPFLITNTSTHTLKLDHGSMGVSAYQQTGLKTSGAFAIAWSPEAFWTLDPNVLPTHGDLVGHIDVSPPTITTVGQGVIFGQSIINYTASWAPGSLIDVNLVLQPGQSAYFTIAVPIQAEWGVWFSRESTSPGPSDIIFHGPLGYLPLTNFSWVQHSGYLEGDWAFVIVPPECDGDINGDGFTNIADFNILAGNFGGGPGATLAQGDLSGDGLVTIADFNILAGDFGCGP